MVLKNWLIPAVTAIALGFVAVSLLRAPAASSSPSSSLAVVTEKKLDCASPLRVAVEFKRQALQKGQLER
jgi:hypothetical protein